MFNVGELILYGRTGVCRVEDIITTVSKDGGGRQHYVLKPLYHSCNITTPVDNEKVFMRPIISREEAEQVIDAIPDITPKAYHNRNLTQLKEHYKQWIESHDCVKLVELTMSLYTKRSEAERQKRKFGAVDERFMREAEELLYGELAAALGIEKCEVGEYIASRVDGLMKARA